jgi:hypothetical protein
MNQLTTTTAGAFDAQNADLARHLGLNPSNPADQAVIAIAAHYGLDPLLKHIVVIPKSGPYITRDGLLHIAHRSGQLDGIVVEQDPTLVDGEWVARVSVYRKDMRYPFTFPGRYPTGKGNREYAQEMALKAAESHALRRAFDVNGVRALDEREPAATPARESAAAALAAKPDLAPLFAEFERLGLGRDEALAACSEILGRAVDSTRDLSAADVITLVDALAGVDLPAPAAEG